mgnify:CR=1 FL=1
MIYYFDILRKSLYMYYTARILGKLKVMKIETCFTQTWMPEHGSSPAHCHVTQHTFLKLLKLSVKLRVTDYFNTVKPKKQCHMADCKVT